MINWSEKLALEKIPEQYRHLAELIGVPNILIMSKEYGGSNVYIPKHEAIIKTARDEMIKTEFNGYNAEELARTYELSIRWVQHILKDAPMGGQMSLLDFVNSNANS